MSKKELDQFLFGEDQNTSQSGPSGQNSHRQQLASQTPPLARTVDSIQLRKMMQHNERLNNNFTPNRSMTYGSNKTNEELQEIIEKIHCPVEDLSITTFTNSTHNNSHQAGTPNKLGEQQQSPNMKNSLQNFDAAKQEVSGRQGAYLGP